MEEYSKKTTRQKYAKSEVYAKFKHGIFVRTSLKFYAQMLFIRPIPGGAASRYSHTTYFRVHPSWYGIQLYYLP